MEFNLSLKIYEWMVLFLVRYKATHVVVDYVRRILCI